MCLRVNDDGCCGNLRSLATTILWINFMNAIFTTGSHTFRCISSDGLEFQWSVIPALSIAGVIIATIALYGGIYNNNSTSMMIAVYFEATLLITDLILVATGVLIVLFDEDLCKDELKKMDDDRSVEISCNALKISYFILSFFTFLIAGYHWYAMSVLYNYCQKIKELSLNNMKSNIAV